MILPFINFSLQNSRQYQKFSPRMTKEFVYSGNDFDENGLIYTLGSRTNGSSRSKTSSSKQQSQHISQYQNPHVLGILNVTMSSVLFGCPANITSRNQIATCTKRDNNSWISIDFGPSVEIQVKAYTLMHGASKDNVNLKSWVLEGCNSPPKSEGEAVAGEGGAIGNATTAPHPSSSNNSGSVADTTGDDGQWIVISSHFNDPSLSGAPYKTATWVLGDKSSQSIDKHTKSGPGKEAFWRRLRVRTLGNYFVQVSGFEVYGVVKSDFSL